MTVQLSDRINNLSESQTLAMARISRELQAEGKDIISLSIGEPDFDTPEPIKQAAIEAINQNFTHYTPVPGIPELREAIANKLKRDNNLTYQPDQIVVSTGAKQSLANIALALLNPGDEVLLPAPYWVSYKEIIKLAEAVPVEIPTSIKTDFKITANQLENAITPKTKMIWYSSPCNPSGSVYSKEELAQIAQVIKKHPQITVVSDEIYELINFSSKHESIAQFEEIKNQVIIVNGVSKGFAMTGWRIGYIAAPQEIANACSKMQGQITSGANSIAQKASVKAMQMNPEEMAYMKSAFKNRRDKCIDWLKNIEDLKVNEPKGAFYLFPDISAFFGKSHKKYTINNATDLAMYLLYEANVAVVTGEAFGDKNCIRLSYAASEDVLKEAISRIGKALAQLQ
ncbi:MAG TPA: aspartate aminotransferase [Flavobacteriales bacterium]|nr:aspartate aminotransferase [Flavobacteriales bacterium]